MSDPMIFQFIGESITAVMDTYVQSTVPQVIAKITATAVVMGSLYYACIGMLIAMGRIEGVLSTLMLSAGKFLLIGVFALSAGNYTEWVLATGHGLEEGLAQAFSGSAGESPTSVYQVLDDSIGRGWDLAGDLWSRAADRGVTETGMMVGEYLNAVIIALATLIIAVPAGAMIVASKTLLELLLGIGPFFIMMLMWPATKAFFDRWFGEVMTVVLQIALVTAVLAFAMKIFVAMVGAIDIDSLDASPFFDALRLIAVTMVMLWVMYVVYQKAASLAGGMSSAAITFGAVAARAVGLSSSAAGAVNAPSTRRDLESGMMTTAGRLNHLAAGNAVWNPRYARHVLGQFGKNWGLPERRTGGTVRAR